MKIQKYMVIESVEDFLKHLPPKEEGFELIYRGHELASYKLVPSLYRHTNYPRERDAYIEILDEALEGICQDEQWREMDDFNKSAIAQHHGIPTPILDWSFCPKVALFFASQYTNSEEEAEIIALYGKPQPEPDEGYDIDSAFPYLNIPESCQRHTAQKGLFTYSPFFEDGNPVPIDQIMGDGEPIYSGFRYRLPSNLKDDIQKELYEKGVHFKGIYPDNEGISKHASWKIRRTKKTG